MATVPDSQHDLPVHPSILSAGERETRDDYAAQISPRPTPDQIPYLTPYLGLRARLSQIWINRWTILLLLVLVRTLFAIASLDDNLATAKKQAMSACTSVEHVGSTLASMPHYLSDGVNILTADGIEKAIHGLIASLLLTVTGLEELILFVINMLTSTYVCLITFAVGGSLHIAIDVAEDVGGYLNSTVKDVGHDLSGAVADFQTLLGKFLTDVDKIGSVLSGKTLTPPTINLQGSINKLNSLQLPANYDHDLSKLNASIPTFAQVQNFTNNAISIPFEELKKLLNASLGTYTANHSIFPVPQKKQLSFCSGNEGIDGFFAELIHIEHVAHTIFLVVLLIAAALVCIPMTYREIRRWRFMVNRAQIVKTDAHEPMDAVYLVSRPYTSSAGLQAANLVNSSRHKTIVRWAVAYATTGPALFVLSLALAGLLSCLCQYVLLKAVEKEVPVLENQIIGFADKVISALDDSSSEWANGANDILATINNDINHDVFGWVNISTTAVNNTLNVFVDEMLIGLNATFGGTPLYTPVLEVLNCLVLLKVNGIEKALTWAHDHAHVDFPRLPNDTFSIGTLARVSEAGNGSILATGPGSTATDEISSIVNHVTSLIAKTIRQEAIISTCVLLVWVIIVLIGLVTSAYFMLSPDTDTGRGPQTPMELVEQKLNAKRNAFAEPVDTSLGTNLETKPAQHSEYADTYNGFSYTLSRRPPPTLLRHDSVSMRSVS